MSTKLIVIALLMMLAFAANASSDDLCLEKDG